LNVLVRSRWLGHPDADGHRKFVPGDLAAGSGVKSFSRFSGCGAAPIAFLRLIPFIHATSACSSFVILLLLSRLISAALLAAAHMQRGCFSFFSEQFPVRDDLRHCSFWKHDRKFC